MALIGAAPGRGGFFQTFGVHAPAFVSKQSFGIGEKVRGEFHSALLRCFGCARKAVIYRFSQAVFRNGGDSDAIEALIQFAQHAE